MVVGALAVGWIVQAASWAAAAAEVRGAAAAPGTRAREVTIRLAMAALVVAALGLGARQVVPLHSTVTQCLVGVFLAGQALAVAGRHHLGRTWGIDTGPRPDGPVVVHSGVLRHVRHPIYAGTTLACLAQAALLQNLPALLLLAGALIVNPVKIARENRWIRRHDRS